VVELLKKPKTVDNIAKEADVSRGTADNELERLESDDWVKETTVDGKKAYDLNPVRMLFDEITNLIKNNNREDLEEKLTELKEKRENLSQEYGVDSLKEFRESIAEEDLSAEEIRERRKVSETWEAVDSELRLTRHALRMYDDVVRLSSGSDRISSTHA
jgi:DNA-binding transcriptional regulator GbsR (MarR family)